MLIKKRDAASASADAKTEHARKSDLAGQLKHLSDGEDRGPKREKRALHCRIGGIAVDETVARVLWPMVAMNPISYEEYQETLPKTPDDPDSLTDLFARAFHRYGLMSLLIERGGFTCQEACCVLYDHPGDHLAIERRVSLWLHDEFKKMPKGTDAVGAAPVRRLGFLSPLDIADLAIGMLDYDHPLEQKPPPTVELIDLLAHLLGVTRHREAFANSDSRSRKFSLAARIDGQAALLGKTIPVRQLAKLVSMGTGTIVTWRRSARYKELVDFEKQRPFIGEAPQP
jgi:hypothetical protein